MKAKEAVRRAPVTVTGDTPIAEVAQIMDREGVGAVVIIDGGSPIGIATDRDLVVRGLSLRRDFDTPIIDVMSINLVTLDSDAEIRDAIALFSSHAIRRLPLTKGGEMVGMLSLDDLVIDYVFDLASLVRPVVGEVVFGHTDKTN